MRGRIGLTLVVVVVLLLTGGGGVASAGYGTPGPPTHGYTVLIDGYVFPDDAGGVSPFDVGVQQVCTGRLTRVDLATGALEPLSAPSSTAACAGDLAFAPDGTLYGLVQGEDDPAQEFFAQLVRFDLTSGAATIIGRFGPFTNSIGGVTFPFGVPFGGISFDAQGRLFAVLGAAPVAGFDVDCASETSGAFCLYRVDDPSAPGTTTFVGVVDSSDDATATLAASCSTMYTSLLTVEGLPASSSVLTISPDDAASTPIGTLGGESILMGDDFDAAQTFWGLVMTFGQGLELDLVTLDPAGGSPMDSVVTGVQLPDETLVTSLAVEPLDCTPEPIVLEPTFTG